jgi:hypothetical protein
MSNSRHSRSKPNRLRINIVGCGAISRWLLRPLLSYLTIDTQATFEVRVIDGHGHKARRIADDALTEFHSAVVSVIPEYLTEGNIADHIIDDDFVFVCVDNCATIKLISDHAVKLRDTTAMSGGCDWCDGTIQVHVRRQGKNLTPPFANKYHPEYINPRDRNPGEQLPSGQSPVASEPRCMVATNLTAAVMIAVFLRVRSGLLGKSLPEYGEYFMDANRVRLVGRERTE